MPPKIFDGGAVKRGFGWADELIDAAAALELLGPVESGDLRDTAEEYVGGQHRQRRAEEKKGDGQFCCADAFQGLSKHNSPNFLMEKAGQSGGCRPFGVRLLVGGVGQEFLDPVEQVGAEDPIHGGGGILEGLTLLIGQLVDGNIAGDDGVVVLSLYSWRRSQRKS